MLLAYLQLPEPPRQAVHRRAVAAVAPGGTLALVAHHRDNLVRGVGGPPTPDVLFDEEQLRSDFAALSVVRCEEAHRAVGDATAIDIVCVARREGQL